MLNFFKRLFQPPPRNPKTIPNKQLSLEAEAWLYTDMDGKPLSTAARAFVDGKTSTLTAGDIDPGNSDGYASYSQASALKQQGDLLGAARLLESSCEPASIYQGHYRLLFQIWRQLNRNDLKELRYEPIIERVTRMIRYDDQMIAAMLEHYGIVQRTRLPPHHFDSARNLKISDAKALFTAATALSRSELVTQARRLIKRFQ